MIMLTSTVTHLYNREQYVTTLLAFLKRTRPSTPLCVRIHVPVLWRVKIKSAFFHWPLAVNEITRVTLKIIQHNK